jgi:thioesterase domain-containing protein
MGFKILVADDSQVQLFVPLQPNRNHLGTAFGGSLYSMAVLSCYAWLFNQLQKQNLSGHVVIKSGQIKYFSAVSGDFNSICLAPEALDFENFFATLKRKNKSQISLKSQIRQNSQVKCEFAGEFVATL